MGDDNNDRKSKHKIVRTFKQAVINAGYDMHVKQTFGRQTKFSEFSQDVATDMALNLAMDWAVKSLKRQGIKIDLGGDAGGGTFSRLKKYKPDHFTVILDTKNKSILVGARWDF